MCVRVALTFDCEHPDHPSDPVANLYSILDTLGENEVEATFFVQRRWASAHPGSAQAIRDAGHLIGSHSHYHAPMTALTESGLNLDITSAETAIRAAAKVDPKPWFRPPFGKTDNRVEFFVNKWGYKTVGWTVDGQDWSAPASYVRSRIAETIHDGAIVLLHTWPRATVEALPGIIEDLRAKGASFVRLDA